MGHPTKTREFDKSLLLGVEGYEWLSKPLKNVKKLRAGQSRLWPLSIVEHGKNHHAALKDLGLANLGLTLYALLAPPHRTTC